MGRSLLRQPALPYFHPVTLLATWFWSGLSRFAPGTCGSLAALPFAVGLVWLTGPWGLLVAAVLVFFLGLWVSERYAEASDQKDPGAVVIDEVAAQWLALVPVALDLRLYLFAFLAFRVFDIFKPWPAGWCDRNLKGGLGIMADDVFAGLYAALLSYGVSLFIESEPYVPWTS